MPACRSPTGSTCRRPGRATPNGAPGRACRRRPASRPSPRSRSARSARRRRWACHPAWCWAMLAMAWRPLSGRPSPGWASAMCLGVQSSASLWPPGEAPLPVPPYGGRGRPPTRVRRAPGHEPVSAKKLAEGLPARAWRRTTWREGSRTALTSRFAARRVRPAHRDQKRREPWPEEWLLIEWPKGAREPAKYWLSNLPPHTALKDLVHIAKARWLIERDYQELKQGRRHCLRRARALRGPRLARLPPSRQPLHRSLRLPHGRALPFPPCAPLHPPAARGTCVTRRLPAARRRRSGLSGTCRTQSAPSASTSSPASSEPCRAAHAVSSHTPHTPGNDTVRLSSVRHEKDCPE